MTEAEHFHGIEITDKPILLVDMDGVLCDFVGKFNDIWRLRYPDRFFLAPEKATTFYFEDEYPEEYKEDIREIVNQPGFFSNLDPLKGSLVGITQLSNLYNVFICTSPLTSNPTCLNDKYNWVKNYLGTDWLKKLIITKDKTLIQGTFLLDDKPEIYGNTVPTWEHVIFDQPYNRQSRKRRVNWENVYQFFESEYYNL